MRGKFRAYINFKENFVYNKPEDLPEGLVLRRYMNLWKFTSFLQTKQLFLAQAGMFYDKFEGYPIIIDQFPKEYQWFYKILPRCTFINCWATHNVESYLMWKSYCPEGEGVSIAIRYDELNDLLNRTDGFLRWGFIRYLEYEEIQKGQMEYSHVTNYTAHVPYFDKQKYYESEQEFRIVKIINEDVNSIAEKEKHAYRAKWENSGGFSIEEIKSDTKYKTEIDMAKCKWKRSEDHNGILLPFDPTLQSELSELIDGIFIYPGMPEAYCDVVRGVVKQYAPNLVSKISKSDINTSPSWRDVS